MYSLSNIISLLSLLFNNQASPLVIVEEDMLVLHRNMWVAENVGNKG